MPYKQADGSTKNGPAQYNSWMQLTQAQLDAIVAVEGVETGDPGKLERFAQLVHVVNSSSSESSGGGAIVDGVTDTILATVANLTGANPLATMLVDADGNQIVSFGGSGAIADGVDDTLKATVTDLTNSNPLASMIVDANGDQITSFGATLIAETGTPTPVADGADVDLWVDEYGRQVMFGANLSVNALDVNLINDATVSRLGPVLNLNAATATGAGGSIDVSLYHNYTVQIIASAITTGLTVDVESSLDGTNWTTISTNVLAANGSTEIAISQQAYLYLRTNIVSRTDGTVTTYIYAGN